MARKPIVFMGQRFGTQEEFKRHIRRSIADAALLPPPITEGAAFDFLMALLRRHPHCEAKLGKGIVGFDIEPAFTGWKHEGHHVVIVRRDGTREPFSYRKCIIARDYPVKTQLYAAMRVAVSDQSRAFRDRHPFPYTCECGVVFHDNIGLEVHHHGRRFQEIRDEFLNLMGSHPVAFRHEDYRTTFLPEDFGFEQSWREFHGRHAALVLKCESCHAQETYSRNGSQAV